MPYEPIPNETASSFNLNGSELSEGTNVRCQVTATGVDASNDELEISLYTNPVEIIPAGSGVPLIQNIELIPDPLVIPTEAPWNVSAVATVENWNPDDWTATWAWEEEIPEGPAAPIGTLVQKLTYTFWSGFYADATVEVSNKAVINPNHPGGIGSAWPVQWDLFNGPEAINDGAAPSPTENPIWYTFGWPDHTDEEGRVICNDWWQKWNVWANHIPGEQSQEEGHEPSEQRAIAWREIVPLHIQPTMIMSDIQITNVGGAIAFRPGDVVEIEVYEYPT